MNITVISGTNRPGSVTRKVADRVAALYREHGVSAEVLDLNALPLEVFSPDAYAQKPPAFERFAQAVLQSDGLHVVTPEYNGGAPGVLKYFIDLLPFPASFENRPVSFTGLAAGMWGGLRPVEQLQAIFGFRNAYLFPQRVFLAGVGGLFSTEGHLANAEAEARLREQVAGFVAFVRAVNVKAA